MTQMPLLSGNQELSSNIGSSNSYNRPETLQMFEGTTKDDTLSCLNGIQTVIVTKQTKGCTCCKKRMIYVHIPNIVGPPILLFDGEEQNDCCHGRSCVFDCRNFSIPLRVTHPQFPKRIIANLKKEWLCPCNCGAGSTLKCYLNNGEYLGLAKDPYGKCCEECCKCDCCNCFTCCCDPYIKLIMVKNNADSMIYGISIPLKGCCDCNCCNCCCCGCCCRGCSNTVHSGIYPASWGGMQVGNMIKKLSCTSCCGYDNYMVNFPADATNRIKLLLITAAIMGDYLYYDNRYCCERHVID